MTDEDNYALVVGCIQTMFEADRKRDDWFCDTAIGITDIAAELKIPKSEVIRHCAAAIVDSDIQGYLDCDKNILICEFCNSECSESDLYDKTAKQLLVLRDEILKPLAAEIRQIENST